MSGCRSSSCHSEVQAIEDVRVEERIMLTQVCALV